MCYCDETGFRSEPDTPKNLSQYVLRIQDHEHTKGLEVSGMWVKNLTFGPNHVQILFFKFILYNYKDSVTVFLPSIAGIIAIAFKSLNALDSGALP